MSPDTHHGDEPRPGYYLTRLRSGGPLVPMRIYWHDGAPDETGDLTDDQGWRVEVNGMATDERGFLWRVDRFWPARDAISKEKHDLMVAQYQWDKTYAPNSIGANPTKAITPEARHRAALTAPPLF